jgi:hypothetical protein
MTWPFIVKLLRSTFWWYHWGFYRYLLSMSMTWPLIGKLLRSTFWWYHWGFIDIYYRYIWHDHSLESCRGAPSGGNIGGLSISITDIYDMTTHWKAVEEHLLVVTLGVYRYLWHDHSLESCRGAPSGGTIGVLSISITDIYDMTTHCKAVEEHLLVVPLRFYRYLLPISMTWPFIGKLLRSTFWWYHWGFIDIYYRYLWHDHSL